MSHWWHMSVYVYYSTSVIFKSRKCGGRHVVLLAESGVDVMGTGVVVPHVLLQMLRVDRHSEEERNRQNVSHHWSAIHLYLVVKREGCLLHQVMGSRPVCRCAHVHMFSLLCAPCSVSVYMCLCVCVQLVHCRPERSGPAGIYSQRSPSNKP